MQPTQPACTSHAVGSPTNANDGRPEQARRPQHRVEAVQVCEALLAVVEDADDAARSRCGGVLEHREDRRVAALHVGRAAADDAQCRRDAAR